MTPYGLWPSPISADVAAQAMRTFDAVHVFDSRTYWLEGRPEEEGRTALVCYPRGGPPEELLPADFDVGTWVNEYGGGAYVVTADGIFACNSRDERVYRLGPAGQLLPITDRSQDRYADLRYAGRLGVLVCVRERHDGTGVSNELAAIPVDGRRAPWPLVGGHDFMASPRPSPDGTRLAWLTADLPNMLWDGSRLWVADLGRDARPGVPHLVAGGDDESVFQPEWSPDGDLYFVSDRSGWWNLYRYRRGAVEALAPMEAEFGDPQWEFDYSTFAFLDAQQLVSRYRLGGFDHLALVDVATGALTDLDLPITSLKPYVAAAPGRIAFIGASPITPPSVMAYDLRDRRLATLTQPGEPVDDRYISRPERIDFPTSGGQRAYALFYEPRNPDVSPPTTDRPPLIVQPHPGPTSDAKPRLDLRIQYFTSRGFAVVAVNYRGSTGYGRAYRERLVGQWGVADVEDCIAVARHLIGTGRVDPRHVVISGASAGGFTALNAAGTTDVFAAAISTSGITDLEAHRLHSPRFQALKLERLVGPHPASAAEYRRRSPVQNAGSIRCPVLLMHGSADSVVPPGHSRAMAAALARSGVPHALLLVEGEGHIFRRADNVRRALEAELAFIRSALGLPHTSLAEVVAGWNDASAQLADAKLDPG